MKLAGSPDGTSLIATSFSYCASMRRARYTSPMPPEPMSATISYAPNRRPIQRSCSEAKTCPARCPCAHARAR